MAIVLIPSVKKQEGCICYRIVFVALLIKPLRKRKEPSRWARSFLARRILLKGISDVRLRSPQFINIKETKGIKKG